MKNVDHRIAWPSSYENITVETGKEVFNYALQHLAFVQLGLRTCLCTNNHAFSVSPTKGPSK